MLHCSSSSKAPAWMQASRLRQYLPLLLLQLHRLQLPLANRWTHKQQQAQLMLQQASSSSS